MGSRQAIYVAVIGEDESVCRSLSRSLRNAHFQAITYSSVEGFLADTKQPSFDWLVRDIQPKGMSKLDQTPSCSWAFGQWGHRARLRRLRGSIFNCRRG
jgi:FixJ family two-component response regulator